jgi:hypothetical protein
VWCVPVCASSLCCVVLTVAGDQCETHHSRVVLHPQPESRLGSTALPATLMVVSLCLAGMILPTSWVPSRTCPCPRTDIWQIEASGFVFVLLCHSVLNTDNTGLQEVQRHRQHWHLSLLVPSFLSASSTRPLAPSRLLLIRCVDSVVVL